MEVSASERGGDDRSPVTMRNASGDWLLAVLFASASCWFIMAYHAWWRAKPYSLVTLNESLAHSAYYCLALAYAAGPLYRSGWLPVWWVRLRRPVGLVGVACALTHVTLTLGPLWGKFGWDFLVRKHWDLTALGATSLALAGWVAWTSFGDSLRRFGRQRWRRIQLTGLVLLPLVLAHFLVLGKATKWMDWFQGRDPNPAPGGTILIFSVGVVVIALRVADWFAGRFSRRMGAP